MSLGLFPTAKFRKVTNELKVPFRIKVVILFVKLLHPDRPFLPLKYCGWCDSPSDSTFFPGIEVWARHWWSHTWRQITSSLQVTSCGLQNVSKNYVSHDFVAFQQDHLWAGHYVALSSETVAFWSLFPMFIHIPLLKSSEVFYTVLSISIGQGWMTLHRG